MTSSFSYRQSKYVVTFQDPSTISDCILPTTLIEQTCNTQLLLSDTKEGIFLGWRLCNEGNIERGATGFATTLAMRSNRTSCCALPAKK